jgi:hypothetical protein
MTNEIRDEQEKTYATPANARDQRLAEKAFQNRPACSRVRCIA